MVWVYRKGRTMRFYIDCWELNKKNFRYTVGQKYFKKLDLFKANYQGFIDVTSRHLIVVASPWGLNAWLHVPFGTLNATPAFQRFMNACFVGLRYTLFKWRFHDSDLTGWNSLPLCLNHGSILQSS